MKKPIKCIDCPYYTGIECHGHGEYWGECEIYKDKKKVLEKIFEKKNIYLVEKDVWWLVRDDDSICDFFELDDFSK